MDHTVCFRFGCTSFFRAATVALAWVAALALRGTEAAAQQPAVGKPYFQQEVRYTIDAALDDVKHHLSGTYRCTYINHSPDTLAGIWMHLWGNAFKSNRSAFCRQKLRTGDDQYYFSSEKDRGAYRNLDFSVAGQKLHWRFDRKHPDIALLTLNSPLAPGDSVVISTPFLLQIPASFSRLGHVGTSYQMTQWYPKPAVYDNRGWHPMPYLDQGEFYSEFGNFDVRLTLPENYVVGATGVLETASERAFLAKKGQESVVALAKGVDQNSDPFPPSSPTMKTIRYTAEKVHDFAWFADKRFFVLKDTARLGSGKTVDCWAMFTRSEAGIWKKGAAYVRRAVEFYSDKVGEYPWPHATAVHSALSAGGGMEYPMITVIGDSGSGKSLDDVITHEVGHNWFYGILASNERDHPFMDEGMNSYYESRYMKQYYGDYSPVELPRKLYDPARNGSLMEAGYLLLARERKDTPPDSNSDRFNPIAYGLQVYMKTSLCMYWLEQALGTVRFDDAMQTYYRRWQFKHPYPDDFKAVFQEKSLPVSWFMETMQTQKQTDYAISRIRKKADGNFILTIKNKRGLDAPVPVSALKKGEVIAGAWLPAEQTTTLQMEFHAPGADAFVIDPAHITLDVNRKNNLRRTDGFLPGAAALQVKMLAPFQQPNRNTLGLLPWLGWNNIDKTMLGVLLYTPPLPSNALQLYALPGWGLGSGKFVGIGSLQYRFYPGGPAPKVTVGIGAKQFGLDYYPQWKTGVRFFRLSPALKVDLHSNSLSYRHRVSYRLLLTGEEALQFDQQGVYQSKTLERHTIHEWRYEAEQQAHPNPFQWSLTLEAQRFKDAFDRPAHYLKSSLEWRQQFFYKQKKKVSARIFAGYFIENTLRHSDINAPFTAFSLFPQGFNDYQYDQIFLARAGTAGVLGRQVSQTQGGFKGAFGSAFAGVLGHSNNVILALNLKADLPEKLPLGIPLKPYFDLGYFDDATPLGKGLPLKEQILWNGGFTLELMKGGLEIYFPLFSSANLKRQYCEQAGGSNNSALFCGGNYLKMISWSVKLKSFEPMDAILDFIR